MNAEDITDRPQLIETDKPIEALAVKPFQSNQKMGNSSLILKLVAEGLHLMSSVKLQTKICSPGLVPNDFAL